MKKRIFIVVCLLALFVQFVSAVTVTSIAEYAALPDDSEVTFGCRLAVLAQKGMKLYVSDGQRGAVIYGKLNMELNHGDLLEPGLTAKKVTFDYSPEMTQVNMSTLKKANARVTVKPVRIAMSEVNMDKVYCFTRLVGHFDASSNMLISGDKKVFLYNSFNKEMPQVTGRTTVDGILVYYKKKDMMELFVM